MKAHIVIRGTQNYEDQDAEVIELATDGTYECLGELCRISYEESEVTGMEGTTTTFEVWPKAVILERTGAVKSRMVFQIGQELDSLYDMGYGALLMTVAGRRIESTLNVSGGKLILEYSLEIEKAAKSINTYDISVTPFREK